MRPAVAYIRVSTGKQGKSGLGLEAQKAALMRFAELEDFEITQTFTEVESGKYGDDHRPELNAALAAARKRGAPVIVAKLDRLSWGCALHFRPDEAQGAVHRCRSWPRYGPVHAALVRSAG